MRQTGRAALVLALGLGLSVPLAPMPASAAPTGRESAAAKPRQAKPVARAATPRAEAPVRRSVARQGGSVLQCVVFARNLSGIHLSGNAHTWWYSANGMFARGQRPEVGAVLNFRASGGMRLGHVSVVSRVVSTREILVDDANWAGPGQRKGQVRRGASVIDVSPNNDWTEVRVANGIGSWGRVYPTFGFIYPRADRSRDGERIEYAAARPLSAAEAGPSPRALREAAQASRQQGGWTWKNGVAVPEPAAPSVGPSGAPSATTAPRQSAPVRIGGPAEAPAPMAAVRWVWVNGQAVPAR